MTAPLRCTVCGSTAVHDRTNAKVTQLDPRFSSLWCEHCHAKRMVIQAETITEATKGYHQLEAEKQARKEAGQTK